MLEKGAGGPRDRYERAAIRRLGREMGIVDGGFSLTKAMMIGESGVGFDE